MTTFAEKHIVFPDGQINVVPLPEAIMRNGFTPETRDAPGMPLPAQYLNWLMRDLYRHANELKEKSETLAGRVIPAWMPIPCPMEEAPEGYLKCNGAAFDKELYPELAQGYPSGVLPDLRGEFIRGWDDGRGVDAGRGVLSLQFGALENHAHGLTMRTGTGASLLTRSMTTGDYGVVQYPAASSGDGGSMSSTYSTGTVGDFRSFGTDTHLTKGTTADETRPRNIAFLYIVRAA